MIVKEQKRQEGLDKEGEKGGCMRWCGLMEVDRAHSTGGLIRKRESKGEKRNGERKIRRIGSG